jgi:hypothetical protein
MKMKETLIYAEYLLKRISVQVTKKFDELDRLALLDEIRK